MGLVKNYAYKNMKNIFTVQNRCNLPSFYKFCVKVVIISTIFTFPLLIFAFLLRKGGKLMFIWAISPTGGILSRLSRASHRAGRDAH